MNIYRNLVVSVSVFLLTACGGGGGDSDSGGGQEKNVTTSCVREQPVAQVQGSSDFFNTCDFNINIAFVFGGEFLVGEKELAPGQSAFGLVGSTSPPIACRAPSIPVFSGGASCN